MSVRLPDFKLAITYGFKTFIFIVFLCLYADDGLGIIPLAELLGNPKGV